MNQTIETGAAEAKVATAKARPFIPAHYEVGRVAMLLDMSPRFVKDHIKSGDLEGFRLGNRVVVTAESIRTFLDNRRIQPKEDAI